MATSSSPTNLPIPQSYRDLYALYGDPHALNFESDHIVRTPHVIAGGKGITIAHHRGITDSLHNVFFELHKTGLIEHIQTYDGCFVIRNVRGMATPSLHSWGVAVDFNAAEYPLGSTARFPQAVVDLFARHNWFYGGNFHHRPDGMHFQHAGDF